MPSAGRTEKTTLSRDQAMSGELLLIVILLALNVMGWSGWLREFSARRRWQRIAEELELDLEYVLQRIRADDWPERPPHLAERHVRPRHLAWLLGAFFLFFLLAIAIRW
ncbi:MAG: hypothetical protein Q9O62_05185 [Ardenticatenia bacterium]|nr:hypothetical protein [Ardenticatenia bacterium]